MENNVSNIRLSMREVIDSSKIKQEKLEHSINPGPVPGQKAETINSKNGHTNYSLIQKLSSIVAPDPREVFNFVEKRAHSLSANGNEQNNAKISNEESTRFSARISSSAYSFIKSFASVLTKNGRKNAGGGSKIEMMIEELIHYRNEEQDHLREIIDFVRQTQNAEKNYKTVFGRGNEEELEAKQKFNKSISTLAFVLDLKKFSDQRLVQLMNSGLLAKEVYWEIHYYLHSEIYTKWKGRGLA